MDRREGDGFDDLPILGELRDALAAHMLETATAAGAAPGRRPSRAWVLAGARRAGLALAVVVALGVVAVGLVALHHRAGSSSRGPAGHGTPSSAAPIGPAPPVVSGEIGRARKQVVARDHACAQTAGHGATTEQGSPPASMLSVVGVLRRPPLPPDPTDKVVAALGWPIGGGVFVNDLRRARTEFGRSYWLIPEARATPFAPIPSRCYAEFRATLKRDLRHASRVERDVALRAQQEQLGVQRLQSEHRQGLCFAAIALDTRPRPGAAGYGCSAAPTAARPLGVGAIDPVGGGATIQAGVVADGYVSVSAHFPGGKGAPALTVTSSVVNNVYVIRVPHRPDRADFVVRWRLRRADGAVVTIGFNTSAPVAKLLPKPPPVAKVRRTQNVRTTGAGGG